MTAKEAMADIEGLKFAVRVGLANSFRAFLRNASGEPSVGELLDLARSRNAALEIWKRVVSLSKLRSDFRYVNRFDLALATYLWILSRTFPELARAGAEAAADLPRTWWTEQVCQFILGEWSQKPTTVASSGARHVAGNLASINTSNVASSSSIFFPNTVLDFAPAVEANQASSAVEETLVVINIDDAQTEVSPIYTTRTDSRDLVERQ